MLDSLNAFGIERVYAKPVERIGSVSNDAAALNYTPRAFVGSLRSVDYMFHSESNS
jgi:hypothetical protein